MKTLTSEKLWRRSDNGVLFKTLLLGLAVGLSLRWLSVSAPPLPVWAQEIRAGNTTNSPTVLKSEGASPSARD